MSGSHISFKKVFFKHFICEIIKSMQYNFTGDHENEHSVEAMDTVNPVILNCGCNLRLFLLLDKVPNVPHLGNKNMPLFYGYLAGICIQVTIQKSVVVSVRHYTIHYIVDLHWELADIIVVKSILENYLLLWRQCSVERYK